MTKLLRKRFSIIAFYGILLLFIAFLPSCSRQTPGAAKHEIEFMNWEITPEGSKFMTRLIAEFERENPNIKVRNVAVSPASGSYSSKLLTRIAGGTPPDIFEIQAEIIHPFVKKGLLLDLTPHIAKSKALHEEDFFPISLINFRFDGKNFQKGDIYCLPKDIGYAALIYNKDLFDKAGLEHPNDNWTVKEYMDAARKLTKRDRAGRPLQLGVDRPIGSPGLDLVIQNGGRIWSADYKKCLLDSKPAISAYQFLYDLCEVQQYSMRGREGKGGMSYSVGFRSGKAGMSMIYRFELPDVNRYIAGRFKWDIVKQPLFNGRRTQVLQGPSGWSISKKTKYPEDCFKFMEFLVGRKGQIATAKMGWNVPSNKKIAYSDVFLKNLNRPDSERINRIFIDAFDDMDPSLLNPYIPMERVNQILETNLDAGVVGRYGDKVDVPLANAVREIDAIIQENYRGGSEWK